ncbi:hypothetical protein ACFVFF_05965 [Streptomyces sp. NPDC057680]|uniref:hypothetical protein n=1 Tax=Streptomyces sp. NPDC057680 TaxID=3346208 RepID=UPI0036AC5186
MPTNLLKSAWTPGLLPHPATAPPAPLTVTVTAFRPHRMADLPGIHGAARALAARWTELEGAYGMWLWALPLSRRVGSVAVWRDEAALRDFIGWPPHVEIMRTYRGRGALTTTAWRSETYDPEDIWTRARTFLEHPRREPKSEDLGRPDDPQETP